MILGYSYGIKGSLVHRQFRGERECFEVIGTKICALTQQHILILQMRNDKNVIIECGYDNTELTNSKQLFNATMETLEQLLKEQGYKVISKRSNESASKALGLRSTDSLERIETIEIKPIERLSESLREVTVMIHNSETVSVMIEYIPLSGMINSHTIRFNVNSIFSKLTLSLGLSSFPKNKKSFF